MPMMPRLKGKATKIAWKILGIPLVFKEPQKTSQQKKRDKFILVEETARVR